MFDCARATIVARQARSRRRQRSAVCAHRPTRFSRTDTPGLARAPGGHPALGNPESADNGRGLAVMLGSPKPSTAPRSGRGARGSSRRRARRESRSRRRQGVFADAHDRVAPSSCSTVRRRARRPPRARSRRFRITYRGTPGGHSWAAYGFPIRSRRAAAVKRTGRSVLPREPRTTLTVGASGGGISVNCDPRRRLVRRSTSRSTSADLLERHEPPRSARRCGTQPLSRTAARARHAAAELPDRHHRRPAVRIRAADHPLVTTAIDATRLIGRDPDLAAASTDAMSRWPSAFRHRARRRWARR